MDSILIWHNVSCIPTSRRTSREKNDTLIVQNLNLSTEIQYPPLCKKGCYTVLYNACNHVLCTRYARVIRMCITLRMDTLYTVAHSNYSITLCITSV